MDSRAQAIAHAAVTTASLPAPARVSLAHVRRSSARDHVFVNSRRVASLGMVALAAACRQPDAPRVPPSRSSFRAPEAAPSGESTRAALLACVPTPALIVRPGCALHGPTGAMPVACVDLSPAGSPSVDVLFILVAEGRYDFARTLGVPSMQTALDAKTPGVQAMAKVYRDFEGPRFEPLPDGRQVKLEARGLMLGGVVRWATLPSPRVTFTTVLVQQIPLHDAPLADADRAAVERWDLAAMVACFDRRFWHGS